MTTRTIRKRVGSRAFTLIAENVVASEIMASASVEVAFDKSANEGVRLDRGTTYYPHDGQRCNVHARSRAGWATVTAIIQKD